MNLSGLKTVFALTFLAVLRLVLFVPLLAASAATLRNRRDHTAPAWAASPRLWEPAHDDIELSVVIPA